MKHIYLLQHSYEVGEYDETKIIGIYSSRELAERTIENYKNLPGFIKYPVECFHIDRYEVNQNNWQEGFIAWQEANREQSDNKYFDKYIEEVRGIV